MRESAASALALRRRMALYLCGWSGKPLNAARAGSRISSSIRNGSRLRSCAVPSVLQICTPPPAATQRHHSFCEHMQGVHGQPLRMLAHSL